MIANNVSIQTRLLFFDLNAIIASAHESLFYSKSSQPRDVPTPNRLNVESSQRRVGHAESSHVEKSCLESPRFISFA